MSQKNLNTRMISKHDTQAKWENVSDFIPYKGEIIVYDRDDNYSYERFKIGDGVTTINELPFAAIQPDWSQNDETAADYVKNRTHWVEEGYAEIMPETTIVATDEGRLYITEPLLIPLIDGQEYTVTYNGVEYKTLAMEMVEDGITAILLGDYGLIMGGTSTGEPFIIVVYPDGLDSIYGEVMDIGGAASVTIKIILDGTITHRLDQKYLPEHIYSAEKVSGVVLPETTVTADATAFLINVAPVNQPILGVNHTVVWNGVSYDCVAVKDDTSSEVIACMLGDSVTTPFSIGVLNSQGIVQTGSYFYVFCNDGKGEKTISININGEKIRTIDMKFLPEELFTKIDSSNLKNGNTEGSLRTIGSNKESDDYALGKHALSTGRHTSAKGEAAHAEGGWTEANGNDSHAEGKDTIANGENSHAEGERAKANGRGSHAEGWDSISTGMSSHAEGYHSESEGIYAHAEGYNSVAKGRAAHTEGQSTIAYGISSHAEGLGTYSDSAYSHVIGSYNLRDKKFDSDYISVKTENIEKTFNRLHSSYSIINNNVHPTKFTTVSYSDQNHFGYSVSFGQSINDQYSTSLSWANLQPGNLFSSDISGENWATYYYEVVEILTITDTEITLKLNKYECISRSYEKAKYVHIVGNGESDKERSNAHTLDWDGNAWYAGDVYVGGTSQDDENAKILVAADKNPETNRHLATDADGNVKWEEKLAYTYAGNDVVLPETTLAYYEEEGFVNYLLLEPFSMPISSGVEYVVNYNGVQYNCTARTENDIVYLGNADVKTGNTDIGEPFLISVTSGEANGQAYYAVVGINDGAENVTISITAKAEMVKTIDPKYLASNNGIHKQLVTDKNGEAVWEDRLAYAYTGIVEILPEITLAVDTDSMDAYISEPLTGNLVAGNEYTVTYNGTDYVCKAQEVQGDVVMNCLGNIGAMEGGEDTGEPFIFVQIPPEMAAGEDIYAGMYALDGSSTVTIKIVGEGESVHRLERKYLPEYMYGDEIEDVIYLNETTLEAVVSSEGSSGFMLTKPFDSPLVMNAVYTVMWNGTEYKCTPVESISNGNTVIVLNVNGVFQIADEIGEYGGTQYFGTIHAYGVLTSLTISIAGVITTVHQVPEKYLPKLNLVNGSAEGSLRTAGSNEETDEYKLGKYALSEGHGTHASGSQSHAEGFFTNASGASAHAEGNSTNASGHYSHAEGEYTITHGWGSHAEGHRTRADGDYSHAEGEESKASGRYSHAEGSNTIAHGWGSHTEGEGTKAVTGLLNVIGSYNEIESLPAYVADKQPIRTYYINFTDTIYLLDERPTIDQAYGHFVYGTYTVVEDKTTLQPGSFIVKDLTNQYTYYEIVEFTGSTDTRASYNSIAYLCHRSEFAKGKYVHIVGNGSSSTRSNAHTLDWQGNAWFQGNVYVGGTNQDKGSEKLLTQSEVNSIINELLAAILPTPTVEDAGKVLRVNEEGKYELVAPLTNEEIDDICGSTVQVSSEMVDEATGESYRLYVSNGELKMEKVV